MKKRYIAITLAAIALPLTVAANNEQQELAGMAKINLMQAIDIAERHHNGATAVEASLEDGRTPVYEVEVMVKNEKGGIDNYEVEVDGITGKVIDTKED